MGQGVAVAVDWVGSGQRTASRRRPRAFKRQRSRSRRNAAAVANRRIASLLEEDQVEDEESYAALAALDLV